MRTGLNFCPTWSASTEPVATTFLSITRSTMRWIFIENIGGNVENANTSSNVPWYDSNLESSKIVLISQNDIF